MASSSPTTPPPKSASTLYRAVRILGFVMLFLILVSILYSGWIAIDNWGDIQV